MSMQTVMSFYRPSFIFALEHIRGFLDQHEQEAHRHRVSNPQDRVIQQMRSIGSFIIRVKTKCPHVHPHPPKQVLERLLQTDA